VNPDRTNGDASFASSLVV